MCNIWCDLDLTFDLVIVTMSFKFSSWLFLGIPCRDIVHHGVTFNFGSAKVCSPAMFETSFSYDKDI